MVAKVIDVTVATIINKGSQLVCPQGIIYGTIVRSINDDEEFQSERLYDGAMVIEPGQSLTVGVNKRLTVHHFDQENREHVNQMLVFQARLKQRYVDFGRVDEVQYTGSYNFKVRFEDIAGFKTFSVGYTTTRGHIIEVVYTVNLVASN